MDRKKTSRQQHSILCQHTTTMAAVVLREILLMSWLAVVLANRITINSLSPSGWQNSIPEDVQIGSFVAHITYPDPNGECTAECEGECVVVLQPIAFTEYQLVTSRSLDFEYATTHHVLIVCTSPDTEPERQRIRIDVQDVNDNAPRISIFPYGGRNEVYENRPPGIFVAHISVLDADSGIAGEVSCQTSSPVFRLEVMYSTEFKLVTQVSLDREVQREYSVDITCSDYGTPSLTSSSTLPVYVADLNDNPPVFAKSRYIFEVDACAPVGTHIGEVQAFDHDEGRNAAVQFSVEGERSDVISVGSKTGALSLQAKATRGDVYSVVVTARDQGVPVLSGETVVDIRFR